MRRVRLAAMMVCVTAATGLGCASTAIPQGQSGLRIGLVSNTLDWGTQQARMQRASRDLGARWLREEIRWREVEPVKGARRWARTDRLVASAARERVHILALLYSSPTWVSKDKTTLPRDPRRFAAFARDVVRRYGPGGAFWRQNPELDATYALTWFEVWNEPYLPQFAGGRPDPGRYARLVRAAGDAIHAAHPDARVLAAAETVWESRGGERDWVRDMHEAVPGLERSYDGASIHPYTRGAPVAASATAASTDLRRIGVIRQTLASVGGPATQLWITEIGWPTCSRRPVCVSERQQARYLQQVFSTVRSRYTPSVRAIFVYALRDQTPSRGRELREAYFGLVTRRGREKPAAAVLRKAAR